MIRVSLHKLVDEEPRKLNVDFKKKVGESRQECSSSFFFVSGALTSDQRFVNTFASPVDNQSFTNEEEHNGNLSNREEAPDWSLFHKIRRDQSSQVWSKYKKEDPLDNHSSLFIKSEERSEHQERMDSSSRDNICRISHRNRPSKMIISSKCAKLFTSKPLSWWTHKSLIPNISKKESCKQHSATNQTKSFDDNITVDVFLVFGKRCVDDVAEIRL